MKRCLYCKKDISEDSVIDFCEKCGVGVFGEKMLRAIIDNMNKAREKGDLYQGIMSSIKTDSNKFNSAKSL